MDKNNEKIIFSDSELLEIHKALHDKRRKSVVVRGIKSEVFEHNNLRQIKYSKILKL